MAPSLHVVTIADVSDVAGEPMACGSENVCKPRGCFGTGIHLWPGLRRYIIEGLDAGGKGDAVNGRWAVRALCLSMTISVVVPVFVLGHIVVYRGIVGRWVLDLFEGFARMVGAI